MKILRCQPVVSVLNAFRTAATSRTARRLLAVLSALGLAAAASVQAQTFTPVPLTPASFTVNTVIPSNWVYRLNAQSVSVTIDHGPSLQTDTVAGFPIYYSVDSGDTFFEQGMNRPNPTFGVPPGGSLLTNVSFTTHIYQLPYWTNWNSNCICLCPYTNGFTYNSQPLTGGPYSYPTNNPYYAPNLTLNNTAKFNALSFLATSGGPDSNNLTIYYADGTVQGPVNFAIPNWFVNASTYTLPGSPQTTPTCGFAYTAQCRCNPSENNNLFTVSSAVTSGSRLWNFDIALSDTNSYVTNVAFHVGIIYGNAQGVNGTDHSDVIIAVSGSTNFTDGTVVPNTGVLAGPFAPIPVSGYNAGFVVPNAAQTLAGLAPLTAVMDNGTNLAGGNNTWFEVGWDSAAPTNGFPAHGSILTSTANPSRTYQMPASYNQSMSTLIDTNHQLVNMTPQTPGTFTAFSLLTCGASIGSGHIMTNYIILQHSDGVNESNLFYGYDWFETTVPYAYDAYERAEVGTSSSTSGRSVDNLDGGFPRIFESEFQTLDGSAVTNIQLGYKLAGGVNWATYVIAVSGSTSFLPVQGVLNYTPAQNVYAGQSATFSVQPGIGSLPQYQWQYTDGLTFTNNLTNGPCDISGSTATISGATTANLLISGVGATEATNFYTCDVYNSAPSSTNSPLAVLSLRDSTSPNITTPQDIISDFGETTLPSPAGLGVGNVIDGTLTAYLNYGPSANTAGPFSGPVGIILSPLAGSTIVNALVFYVAVNASICDPADFMLEGSSDGGVTWTTIVADEPLALPVERNLSTVTIDVTNQVLQEVDFPNSTAYSTYRVTVNNVRNDSTANSMQIAEIQFLGVQQPAGPDIVVQPGPGSKTLLQGGTFITSAVQAGGPSPYYYQWYSVIAGVTNGVSNATNASLVLPNVQLSQIGNYFCVVSNIYGNSGPSTNLALNVIVPTSGYATTIVNDKPLAYWRLDEGNSTGLELVALNGGAVATLTANDYMGDLNGVYTNVYIGVTPGYSTNDPDTAAEFGYSYGGFYSNSFVGQVPAFTNFVAASNSPAGFSVEAWVQQPNGINQHTNGAGIVVYGYGGGGEQFALDCGGTVAGDFRFYFRDAQGTSHPVNSAIGTGPGIASAADNGWHHIVGVLNSLNAATNYDLIYVDGVVAGSNYLGTNILGVQAGKSALSIGARQSGNGTLMNLNFDGDIDEVAIYPYALSASQVLNHYYGADISPYFDLQPANNITNVQGATVTFAATVLGTPALTYQWWITPAATGTPTPLLNATNPTLALVNIQPDASGPDVYYLVASNSVSVTTSSNITLTVLSGPPIIFTDLQPNYAFLVGDTFSLGVTAGGTSPFSYGWYYDTSTSLQNGGRVSGANTNVLTIADAQTSDSGTYQVSVTNSNGTTPSTQANVLVVPTPGFNGFINGSGAGWTFNGNSGASFTGSNVVTLTTAGDQSASTYFASAVYVGGFMASWTYLDINPANIPDSGADGTCFVLQNDPRGTTAVGGGGGSLGISGITPSAELEFNIYAGNAFGGIGYAFATNGVVAPDLTPYPVDIASQNPIYVQLKYLNGILSMTLTETNGAGGNFVYDTSLLINLPALVGAQTAYVGFTGATGGTASTQTVSDFNYVALPGLSVEATGPNSMTVSWPTGVGGYVLQQNTDLTTSNWTNVGGTVTQSGGLNQETITTSGNQVFYRLYLQYTPQ